MRAKDLNRTPPSGQHEVRLADEHTEWNWEWTWRMSGETPMQRADRHFIELLQDLRVVRIGLQILLAFLFTVVFTPRFATLTTWQRALYVATLILAALTMALPAAPVSFHRLVFDRRLWPQLVAVSNVFTRFGSALLVCTLGVALLLVADVAIGLGPALWITGGVLLWFALSWFAVPTVIRACFRPTAADTRRTAVPDEQPDAVARQLGGRRSR